MNILAFSINPIFPEKVTGGSTRHLKNILLHLGARGHQVIALCTRYPSHQGDFYLHPNVRVLPHLRFHQPYPQPYAIPAYDYANILEEIGHYLRWADRFYLHDGELLFPFASRIVPTVVSLRDNIYPETVVGSFLFQAEQLIAIAEYSHKVYLHTAGRFLPGLAQRMRVIHNGLDFAHFSPGVPHPDILKIVPVNPRHDTILLHPHRPEPSKGLSQTIEVADLLVHRYQVKNLKVCVPRWFEADYSLEVSGYYNEIRQQLLARDLSEHFVFHEWVPQALMPDYYRLGRLTLTLGNFVEAFGNVPYEGLACGIPAVVARVGPHRSLLPDALLPKVHFGQAEEAAALAMQFLSGDGLASATTAYLRENFSIAHQLAQYEQTLLSAELTAPLAYQFPASTPETRYQLAPWCYCWGEGIFHDFLGETQTQSALVQLLARFPSSFTAKQAGNELQEWLQAGWVVAQPAQS